MIYLKSTLAGIGAFVATVTAFSAAVTVLITRYPQIAVRMLPLQRHDLGWGSFYSLDFPFGPSRLRPGGLRTHLHVVGEKSIWKSVSEGM